MEEVLTLKKLQKELQSLIKEEEKTKKVGQAKRNLYNAETDDVKLEVVLGYDLEMLQKQTTLVEKQIEVGKRIDALIVHLKEKYRSEGSDNISLVDLFVHVMSDTKKKPDEEMKE